MSAEQWQNLVRLLPVTRQSRPPLDRRWVINAILYMLWTGCTWRALPGEIPNWRSVYTVFRRWRLDGTWEQLHAKLRGRECQSSAAQAPDVPRRFRTTSSSTS